jgi:uncharacterized protein YndB with AHSA1/START domain
MHRMSDIQHSLQFTVSPETVYPLISAANGLRQWWAEDVAEADGALELGFFKRSTVYRLRPLIARPPLEFDWRCETGQEWAGTRIAFRLAEIKSGTLLRFTHADWHAPTDYFVSCNTVWGELMFRLKAVAEGGAPGPLFTTAGMAR